MGFNQVAKGPISCSKCAACCCMLEVMLQDGDDVPRRFSTQDAWGGWVMKRLDDGWCAALDRESMQCTIYAQRPDNCKVFEMGENDCLNERQSFYASPAILEDSILFTHG